jgi:hypothetical protein
MVDVTEMPDGMREHERFVKLPIQGHSFLITLSSRGTIPPPRRLTASPEVLRTGKPFRSIRVRYHIHLLGPPSTILM